MYIYSKLYASLSYITIHFPHCRDLMGRSPRCSFFPSRGVVLCVSRKLTVTRTNELLSYLHVAATTGNFAYHYITLTPFYSFVINKYNSIKN